MLTNPHSNLLLKGLVGSTAFGLATPESDKDYIGLFAVPTVDLHGLGQIQESYVYKNPDSQYHEVGKYCRLALKCNPTILDLLWLKHYNCRTELGNELIALRHNFLSAPYVKNAYFGYATQQLAKLKARNSEMARPAKHARHMLRLLHQGLELYTTGTYSVKLEDPERFIAFGNLVGEQQDYALAEVELRYYEDKFTRVTTVLPARPNVKPIEDWLLKVRHGSYRYVN